MGSNWQEKKISDLCEFTYGKNLPANKRKSSGGIPVYGSNGITGYHNTAYVNEPGLIIGRVGTIGSIKFSKEPFWPICTTFFIPESAVEDILYLFYLFKSIDFKKVSANSAVPCLNRDAAYSIKVQIPVSVHERVAIVSVLKSLDDKIALNRQMCETLQQTAAALFKSWFIDFEPVKANMKGYTPKGMKPELLKLFPHSFADSELGFIPQGWRIGEIGDLLETVGGATPSTKEASFWNGDHYWVTPKDLSSLSHHVLLNTKKRVTQQGLSKISSGLLPQGTVLMSSRAPIGYIAVAEIPVSINQGFIAMKCNKLLGTQFVLQWTLANISKIKSYANGSTFQEISKKAFNPIKIVYPNNALLNEFENIAGVLHKRCVALVRQNEQLTKIRDNLLLKLISGQLAVKNIENIL